MLFLLKPIFSSEYAKTNVLTLQIFSPPHFYTSFVDKVDNFVYNLILPPFRPKITCGYPSYECGKKSNYPQKTFPSRWISFFFPQTLCNLLFLLFYLKDKFPDTKKEPVKRFFFLTIFSLIINNSGCTTRCSIIHIRNNNSCLCCAGMYNLSISNIHGNMTYGFTIIRVE